MSAPVITAPSLRETILAGLGHGINELTARYAFCRDCRPSRYCPDHEEASQLAARVENAAARIRSAAAGDEEARAELIAALDGEGEQ